MSTHPLSKLRAAQLKFIEHRNAAEQRGAGGASRIGTKKLTGGYSISYNGRVWKGEQLVLCSDGSEPIACTNPTCRRFHPEPPGYAALVAQFEAQGMTTSDAQGCADAQLMVRA